MKIDAYLFFDGACAEAMNFYKSVLGGELQLVPVEGNPSQTMHARLEANGAILMGSDWMDDKPYPGQSGVSVCLSSANIDEAKRAYDGLAAGGQQTAPFEATFFSPGFGMLIDRFGTAWMVMAENPDR